MSERTIRFYVYIDPELPIRINSLCKYSEQNIKNTLGINIELIPKGQLALPKTLTALRMGACKEDKRDILECLREYEYCLGVPLKKAEEVKENIIVFTKDNPNPLRVSKSKEGFYIDESYAIASERDEHHEYAVILVKLSPITLKGTTLSHEIAHTLGLPDCENENCMMNRDIVASIRGSCLCDKCRSRLEEILEAYQCQKEGDGRTCGASRSCISKSD